MVEGRGCWNFSFDHGQHLCRTVVVVALQDPRSLGPYGGMEVAFIQEEGLPPLWLPVEKVFAAVC